MDKVKEAYARYAVEYMESMRDSGKFEDCCIWLVGNDGLNACNAKVDLDDCLCIKHNTTYIQYGRIPIPCRACDSKPTLKYNMRCRSCEDKGSGKGGPIIQLISMKQPTKPKPKIEEKRKRKPKKKTQ